MNEPYLSEFVELIREGAGTLDIPATSADTEFTRPIRAHRPVMARELGRVDVHRGNLNKLLERFVGRADRVLDVGCGTGGTTVAMATSSILAPAEVIGVDPNEHSLMAARTRAKGYDLDEDQVRFVAIRAGDPLPFDDDSFDLTVCVSVIEYVEELTDRYRFAAELERVTAPGGHVLLVTPNPMRLRDFHTGRFLGDWTRQRGYPWASPFAQLRDMLRDCEPVDVRAHQLENGLERRGLAIRVPGVLSPMAHALRWQKLLVKKPNGV